MIVISLVVRIDPQPVRRRTLHRPSGGWRCARFGPSARLPRGHGRHLFRHTTPTGASVGAASMFLVAVFYGSMQLKAFLIRCETAQTSALIF
jgi:hypothetical protein